jgi:tungstate transport system ATP-binding protein
MIGKIEVLDITRRYSSIFALECSLKIERDILYAIVGPNGSGKSTLLRILSLMERPDRGDVVYYNEASCTRNPFGDAGFRKQITLVPTRAALFNESVYDNVSYGLTLRKIRKGDMRKLVTRALHEVGLADKERDHAYQLSSGEAQRLALARALACEPDVLFVDEPTASLDPDSTRVIEGIIKKRKQISGSIIVMVTHNLQQAKNLADSVVFMYGGKIEEVSEAGSFFKRPSSELARKFVFGEIY